MKHQEMDSVPLKEDNFGCDLSGDFAALAIAACTIWVHVIWNFGDLTAG